MQNQVVVFNNHNLDIVSKNGQPYLTAPQIGAALGYSRPDKINSIYQSHRDEFTPDMSDTTETVLSGNLITTTRIFSLRGCHLLAMFSKTPVAKEFRRWVLDLIEQHNATVREIHTAQVDMKAIGGMVKRCVNKALADFLSNDLPCDEDDVLRQKYYNITDKDMAETLQRWYWSRNYDVRQALDRSAQRIEELEAKLRMVQKVVC